MVQKPLPDAWVEMVSEEEIRASSPQMSGHPYDFGFLAAMSRLIRTHRRIGQAFGMLFAQIMFHPDGHLNRREREMVAAVAAAAQDCRY